MAGLSKKKLLLPFFLVALGLCFCLYANSEWVIPTSLGSARHFKKSHSKKQRIHPNNIHHFALDDHSEVVYQFFREESQELCDVFWIQKPTDVWHMKTLQITPFPPQGFFVDHFQKTPLQKVESFDQLSFPNIRWTGEAEKQGAAPLEGRSVSTLFTQAVIQNAERSKVRAHLYHKLSLPLASFLLLFGLAPFAMRFKRQSDLFWLTALSLASFITFITLMDGMLILGENQTLAPSVAIFSPLILLFLGVFRRFLRDC